jgi:hypothetical protein
MRVVSDWYLALAGGGGGGGASIFIGYSPLGHEVLSNATLSLNNVQFIDNYSAGGEKVPAA